MAAYREVKFLPFGERAAAHVLGTQYDSFNYSYLHNRATALDLILFRGDSLVSNSIMNMLKLKHLTVEGNSLTNFSHCGIIVTREIFPQLPDNKLYVWETTFTLDPAVEEQGIGAVVDTISGRGRSGVQIRPLEDVIKYYVNNSNTHAVAWCRLKNNPFTGPKRQEVINVIEKLHHDIMLHSDYEINPTAWFSSCFPCLRPARSLVDVALIGGIRTLSWVRNDLINLSLMGNNLTNLSLVRNEENAKSEFDSLNQLSSNWLVCSEMIGIVYKELGLISVDIEPANLAPTDFISPELNLCQQPILIFPNVGQSQIYIEPEMTINGDLLKHIFNIYIPAK